MSDWVWDGGRPSLDLLNTVRDRRRGGRETLHDPADLAVWLRAADLLGDTDDLGEDDLQATRRLRAAIDALLFPGRAGEPAKRTAAARNALASDHAMIAAGTASGQVVADAVAVVNAAAAHAPRGPRLTLGGDGRPVVLPPRPSVPAALGRIALDAIELAGGGEQLRVCAANDCGIRFVDRSPSGNRQWCSMARCGNRTKARRHYARTARG